MVTTAACTQGIPYIATNELAAQLLVALTNLYCLYQGYNTWIPAKTDIGLALMCCVICAFCYDIFFQSVRVTLDNIPLRTQCGLGISYTFLIPVALMSSQSSVFGEIPVVEHMAIALCVIMIITELLVVFTCELTDDQSHFKPLLLLGSLPWLALLLYFVAEGCKMYDSEIIPIAYFAMGVGTTLLWAVVAFFTESVTLPEASIITQALLLFIMRIFYSLLSAIGKKSIFLSALFFAKSDKSLLQEFSVVAGFCTLLVVIVTSLHNYFNRMLVFYSVVAGIAMLVAYPLFYALSGENFVIWMAFYIADKRHTLYLFIYWVIICVVCVFAVVTLNKLKNKSTDHTVASEPTQRNTHSLPNLNVQQTVKNSSHHLKYRKHRSRLKSTGYRSNLPESPTVKKGLISLITTSERKIFHVIVVCAFVPGLNTDMDLLTCAVNCALVVFVMIEIVRQCDIKPLSSVFQSLDIFKEERDGRLLILTPFYLLVGCILPLWFYTPKETPVIALYSGLLSLGIGDALAAVVGSKYGSKKWQGSNKSVQGTLAAIIGQIFALLFIYAFRLAPINRFLTHLSAIVVVSLLEATTVQIDNLVLPLCMFVILSGH